MANAYDVPDEPNTVVCRVFLVPDTYIEEIYNHLEQLEKPWTWRDDASSEPVSKAVDLMQQMIDKSVIMGCTGQVLSFAGDVPEWCLACDGAAYLRVDFPALYAALDPAYHIDADSFAVPDLQGRSVLGAGSGSGLSVRAVGEFGGAETHVLTQAEMPEHVHEYIRPTFDLDLEGADPVPQPAAGSGVPDNTELAGGDGAHNNMHPFVVLNYGIVAF